MGVKNIKAGDKVYIHHMEEKLIYSMEKEMRRRGFSPMTIRAYLFYIGRFLRECGKEPRKITKKDVKDYLDSLVEKNKAGSTLNVHLSSIKFFIEEVMHRNMYLRLKFSKRPKALPTVLTKEETKMLIDAIENPKHKLMVGLMYSAGLRLSELVSLRVKDFEFSCNFGWVRKGKGNKDRAFIIAEKLKKEIQDYISRNKLGYDSWLFGGNKSYHAHPRTVQEIVKNAAKRAKMVKSVHPHTLRHSFATHLVENGCSLISLQSLLGHNSLEMSETFHQFVTSGLKPIPIWMMESF